MLISLSSFPSCICISVKTVSFPYWSLSHSPCLFLIVRLLEHHIMFRVFITVTSLSGRAIEMGRWGPERLHVLSTVTGNLGYIDLLADWCSDLKRTPRLLIYRFLDLMPLLIHFYFEYQASNISFSEIHIYCSVTGSIFKDKKWPFWSARQWPTVQIELRKI